MVSLEVSIDTRHEDTVHDAQMDFYGQFLATCSSDSFVRIFEVSNDVPKEVKEFKEHEGPVWQLSWCHPQFGSILASCGYDKRVVLYGLVRSEWVKVNEFSMHDSSVNTISWAPPEFGAVLASGSSDKTIAISTVLGDGQVSICKIPDAHSMGVNSVCWGPVLIGDGQVVKRLASGGCDNDVKIFTEVSEVGAASQSWRLDSCLRGHSDWVLCCAWRPYTVWEEDVIASGDKHGCVIIWTRPRQAQGGAGEWQLTRLPIFSQTVWHLSWSVVGDVLAVSCGENNISLWRQNSEGHWLQISAVTQGEGDLSILDD